MIFKWIHCKVYSEKMKGFSDAQSKWGEITNSPGFIGQFGGWDLYDTESAYIASLWKDEDSFNYFMEHIHDSITDKNNQSVTYYECNVTFFEPVISMPGKYIDIISAIPDGRFMRVADCIVRPSKISHFEDAQENIWIPEMKNTTGMLGGQFNVNQGKNRYLVTTIWDSEKNHVKYVEQKVSVLRKRADVSDDLISLTKGFIKLAPSWLVLPA